MMASTAWSQIETGTWQDHPNLTRCQAVATAPGSPIVLVAGETGLFTLGLDAAGRSTGEIQRFSKSTGLSGADIVTLAVAPESGWAIVGYATGVFDLVSVDADGTLGMVTTVRDLAEADLPGNKRPRALEVVGDRLLVCTDIGVVEYDLQALEVRDTWKLESDGEPLSIRAAAQRAGRWWLATSSGLWSAPVDAPFPGDPATWEREPGLEQAGAEDLRDVKAGVDGRMAILEVREGVPDRILVGDPDLGTWVDAVADLSEEFKELATDGVKLWASTPFGVLEMDEAWAPLELITEVGSLFMQPGGLVAGGGGVWIANGFGGLVWKTAEAVGAEFDGPYAPNGPRSNAAWRMDAWNDRLWVATGGTEASGVPLYRAEGFSGRKGTYWWSVPPPDGEAGGPGVQDPIDVSIDPTRPERSAFGSLEEGVVELEGPQLHRYWNPGNSPLELSVLWESPRCVVPTLDFDRQGNLWVLNEGTEVPLKMLDAEGTWHTFPLDGLGVNTRFARVLATQSDQIWVLLAAGGGIMVLSTNGTPADPSDDDVRYLGQKEGEGGLPSSFVYSIEEDLDGEIWIGTLQGPAVFYQPQALFEGEGFDAQQILIEQDGNFQFLLETEMVQDIALDGGNRKWIATINSGVFLLSPDGREQVAHFTAANSGLPSNEVYDIAIDQESGMVYFATPQGVTSYRGDATNFRPELDGGGLRVFPNPWRSEYAPNVTIDGLAFGSEIHVVDASGARIRRLESAGGRAVWDTNDDLGRPVPEGVYFLLAGESAGKSGASGKMVILR